MIPQDVAKLLKQIIKVDCTGQGYLRKDGEFCFIGGLYACVDPDWATKRPPLYSVVSTTRLRRKIEGALGLEKGSLLGAYQINDTFSDTDERREALTKWVNRQTEVEC